MIKKRNSITRIIFISLLGIMLFSSTTLGSNITYKQVTIKPIIKQVKTIKTVKTQIAKPNIVLTIKPKERYNFSWDDKYYMARLLCGSRDIDGDGEYDVDFQKNVNYYEVNKVFDVIMNRQRGKGFPKTVKDIIIQPHQFSVMPRNNNVIPSEKALILVQEWCKKYNKYDKSIQVCAMNDYWFTGNGTINITRNHF